MFYRLIHLLLAVLIGAAVSASATNAADESGSIPMIKIILSSTNHRAELQRLKSDIAKVLADQRLKDQKTRQMLVESQAVLTEMLDKKSGENVGKLLDLVKWMDGQLLEQIEIGRREETEKPRKPLTPEERFALENPLAGMTVHLGVIICEILDAYVQGDGEAAGESKLEAALQANLRFYGTYEQSPAMADRLLRKAPNWTKKRFPKLTAEHKKRFTKLVQDEREERALPPEPGETPEAPLPAKEQAAYESAYQSILKDTPK